MSGRDPREPMDDQLERERRRFEQLAAEAGVDLTEPALWDPPPGLEDDIVAEAMTSSAERRSARLIGFAAVLVAFVALAAAALLAIRSESPDWSVTLTATTDAPGATGSVDGWNEVSGTRVVLDIEGLDPAPEGYFYELWFSDGPVHISAGTFRETGGVELWAGVKRGAFPRVWITLEPVDADAAPSGTTVLDTG